MVGLSTRIVRYEFVSKRCSLRLSGHLIPSRQSIEWKSLLASSEHFVDKINIAKTPVMIDDLKTISMKTSSKTGSATFIKYVIPPMANTLIVEKVNGWILNLI